MDQRTTVDFLLRATKKKKWKEEKKSGKQKLKAYICNMLYENQEFGEENKIAACGFTNPFWACLQV